MIPIAGLLTCSISWVTRRCCWWRGVGSRGNKGARTAGVDGQTVYYIQQRRGEESFLAELRADLKARGFWPLPVRERLIPKPGSGKLRMLGIATVPAYCRVVQYLV
jgi:hypothetical protein